MEVGTKCRNILNYTPEGKVHMVLNYNGEIHPQAMQGVSLLRSLCYGKKVQLQVTSFSDASFFLFHLYRYDSTLREGFRSRDASPARLAFSRSRDSSPMRPEWKGFDCRTKVNCTFWLIICSSVLLYHYGILLQYNGLL